MELDPTHPITFGYGATVPTFRAHNLYLEPVDDPGVTKGRVVSLQDNANFRAFWHGTNHLFLNASFFGRGF